MKSESITRIVKRMRARRVTRWAHATGQPSKSDGYFIDFECAEAAKMIEDLHYELLVAERTIEDLTLRLSKKVIHE